MPMGTLEVLLVSAEGLKNCDVFCNMDPYVVINCRTQQQKSTVASGKGSNPDWNETFVFSISDGVDELNLKIMDSDAATEDDFVGEASIPLEGLFLEGSLPPTSYNVVLADKTYCGEIKVGLTFNPKKEDEAGEEIGGRKYSEEEIGRSKYSEEEIGGWKDSSY